jgi:hypothetical protein
MTGERVPLKRSADEAFRRKMTITLEVLKNLTYLTMSDVGDTVRLCRYMALAEQWIADLARYMGQPQPIEASMHTCAVKY